MAKCCGLRSFTFWSFAASFVCLCIGCQGISERWKPIYDDRAQKTWVAGDCLVVDRVTLSGSSDSQTKEYQVIIKVLSDFLMLGPPHHSFL